MADLYKSDPSWQITLLRYFNPIGGHPSGKLGEKGTSEIPATLMDYIMKVAGGELPLLSIFGGDYESKDGTPVRDFIHIVDLAKAHVAAIEPMGEKIKSGSKDNFKIYNVGTNKPYTVLEIVKRFSEVNKVDVPYVIADRRQGDIGISYADNSLIIKELNWRPQYDLDDMCRDAWLWYKKSNEID